MVKTIPYDVRTGFESGTERSREKEERKYVGDRFAWVRNVLLPHFKDREIKVQCNKVALLRTIPRLITGSAEIPTEISLPLQPIHESSQLTDCWSWVNTWRTAACNSRQLTIKSPSVVASVKSGKAFHRCQTQQNQGIKKQQVNMRLTTGHCYAISLGVCSWLQSYWLQRCVCDGMGIMNMRNARLSSAVWRELGVDLRFWFNVYQPLTVSLKTHYSPGMQSGVEAGLVTLDLKSDSPI